MSETAFPKLSPPFNDKPVDDTGFHSQMWEAHHQSLVDKLLVFDQQVADLQYQIDHIHDGVTDGSDAAPGQVGEYMTATGGSVSLTNNVNANLASLDLTAGDWDVFGNVNFAAGSGNHTGFAAGIDGVDTVLQANFSNTAQVQQINTYKHRRNVTATTTVWVVGQATFTGSMTASGTIQARRVR